MKRLYKRSAFAEHRKGLAIAIAQECILSVGDSEM
jgi:hypothetical protein